MASNMIEDWGGMIPISQCRKILGKRYESCTDKQIEKIRELLYKLAKMDIARLTKKKVIK